MHHNPAKNVLFVRASLDEIGKRMDLPPDAVASLLRSAKEKMYAARLKRPTPYVDKTIYPAGVRCAFRLTWKLARRFRWIRRGSSLCVPWTVFWLRVGTPKLV